MRLCVPSIHLLLTAALLLLAVALRIADPEPVARLRLSVFDSYLNVAPRPLCGRGRRLAQSLAAARALCLRGR